MDIIDTNTLRLVGETVRICREEGFKVDHAIAAFLIRALDLVGTFAAECNTACKLSNAQLSNQDITDMARIASRELLVADSPFLCTVRMQVGMEQTFRAEKALVEAEVIERDNQLDSVLQTITDHRLHQDMAPADFERLWNKVVDFVCIKSSMDAALDNPEARAEVSAAVESVLPQYAMPRFVGLPADEKAAQMDEVSSIVLGICALNQSLGRGGLCLPGTASVASYMHQANRLATEVEREIAEVHSGIQEYLLVVRAESAREEPTSPRLQRLRQELTNLQQELAYLGQLREDLLRGIDVVSQQDADRQHLLAELKEVVGGRSAIPKEQVYPLFDDLGNLTSSLIDSSKMLEVQGKLLEALLGLVGGFSRSIRPVELDRAQAFLEANPDSKPVRWSGAPPPVADPERAVAESEARMIGDDEEVPAMHLGGYCPVSLVERFGVLVPADPSIGLVGVRGRVFGCASESQLGDFRLQPLVYLSAAQDAVRRAPELIKLLGVADLFPSMALAPLVALVAKGVKAEFGTQTMQHVKEKNIDVNYEWNVWALRRRALNLANLESRRTKGGQTVMSHFRRENETQVYLPKEKGTMTRVDKGQSMPKKLRYMAGLRGGPKAKMSVLSLELDVGQPHQH